MNVLRSGEGKRELRLRLKNLRDRIPHSERRRLSTAAIERLCSLPDYRSAETIMAYMSCGSELETDELLRRILLDGKRAALPLVDPLVHGRMTAAVVTCPETELKKGCFGIREPGPACMPLSRNEIDLVIVPGLAFDLKGHRLGYGQGYYDRWLDCVPLERRLGLCFDSQLLDRLPATDRDVPVFGMVTERRFIRVEGDTSAVYNRQKE